MGVGSWDAALLAHSVTRPSTRRAVQDWPRNAHKAGQCKPSHPQCDVSPTKRTQISLLQLGEPAVWFDAGISVGSAPSPFRTTAHSRCSDCIEAHLGPRSCSTPRRARQISRFTPCRCWRRAVRLLASCGVGCDGPDIGYKSRSHIIDLILTG